MHSCPEAQRPQLGPSGRLRTLPGGWLGMFLTAVVLVLAGGSSPLASAEENDQLRLDGTASGVFESLGSVLWFRVAIDRDTQASIEFGQPWNSRVDLSTDRYWIGLGCPSGDHTDLAGWRSAIRSRVAAVDQGATCRLSGTLCLVGVGSAVDCFRILDATRFRRDVAVALPIDESNYLASFARLPPRAESSSGGKLSWSDYVDAMMNLQGAARDGSDPHRRFVSKWSFTTKSIHGDYVCIETLPAEGVTWRGLGFAKWDDQRSRGRRYRPVQGHLSDAGRKWLRQFRGISPEKQPVVVVDDEWLGTIVVGPDPNRVQLLPAAAMHPLNPYPGRRAASLLDGGLPCAAKLVFIGERTGAAEIEGILIGTGSGQPSAVLSASGPGDLATRSVVLRANEMPSGEGAWRVSFIEQVLRLAGWASAAQGGSRERPEATRMVGLQVLAGVSLCSAGGTSEDALWLAKAAQTCLTADRGLFRLVLRVLHQLRDRDAREIAQALRPADDASVEILAKVLEKPGSSDADLAETALDLARTRSFRAALALMELYMCMGGHEEEALSIVQRFTRSPEAVVRRAAAFRAGAVRFRSEAAHQELLEMLRVESDVTASRILAGALLRSGCGRAEVERVLATLESEGETSEDAWILTWARER